MKLTCKQKMVIERMIEGATVFFYRNKDGKLCFRSECDNLRTVLYLTLTMRSLLKKNVVYLDYSDGLTYLEEDFEFKFKQVKAQ